LDNINKTKDSSTIKIEDDLKFLKSEPKIRMTSSVENISITKQEDERIMSDNVFERLKQEDEINSQKLSKEQELDEIRKRRLNNLNL
jgi:hypothetical protein